MMSYRYTLFVWALMATVVGGAYGVALNPPVKAPITKLQKHSRG